eukprot:jgi/Chrzof1/3711/Cz13g06050.t1
MAAVADPISVEDGLHVTHDGKQTWTPAIKVADPPVGDANPVVAALRNHSAGISLSGSAFATPYHLGVTERLMQLGIISHDTPTAGVSASALVAVAIRCKIPLERVLNSLKAASKDFTDNGRMGRMRTVLEKHIEDLLPPDAHKQCTPEMFSLSMTRYQGPCIPCWHPQIVSTTFESREELVDALLATAQLPFLSSGRMTARFRGRRYIDGGLRMPVTPIKGVDYCIRVYCLPRKYLTRIWPYRIMQHPPAPEEIDISPGEFSPWPFTYGQCSKYSMKPQTAEWMDLMFERGRQDAQHWANSIGLSKGTAPITRQIKQEYLHLLPESQQHVQHVQ